MPDDFHLNLIRKSAGELLDHCESYLATLQSEGRSADYHAFAELLRWLAVRIKELADMAN